jgi:hypothetical protein
MKAHRNMMITAAALIAARLLLFPGAATATRSESVSGTLPGYETTVERETEGQLSEENLRQTSLLGSQLLLHLNSAASDLEAGESDAASAQINKALTLIGIIRDLLPVTVETTVVKNRDGEEVYRHAERSQDDLIPIYEEMTAVEVVQPILDVRKERAAVEGVQLADVDLIRTSVRADVGYIERRLLRARATLQSPDTALEQLKFAQVRGLRFSVNKVESPLLEAQRALRLAEKMAEDENYKAATTNLLVARNQLTLYRGLIPAESAPAVKDLQKEIAELEGRLDGKSAGEIRGFWQRVTGWLGEEPGQPTSTAETGQAADTSS